MADVRRLTGHPLLELRHDCLRAVLTELAASLAIGKPGNVDVDTRTVQNCQKLSTAPGLRVAAADPNRIRRHRCRTILGVRLRVEVCTNSRARDSTGVRRRCWNGAHRLGVGVVGFCQHWQFPTRPRGLLASRGVRNKAAPTPARRERVPSQLGAFPLHLLCDAAMPWQQPPRWSSYGYKSSLTPRQGVLIVCSPFAAIRPDRSWSTHRRTIFRGNS